MYTNYNNYLSSGYKSTGKDPYESLNQQYTINSDNLNKRFVTSKVPVSFNRQPDISKLYYNNNNITQEFINKYWDFIHIIGRTYDKRDNDTLKAIKCLFFSLADILPDENFRIILTKFINFDVSVLETLLKSTETMYFLQANPDINAQLKNNQRGFFNYCTENSDRLFAWTYLLHIYYNVLMGISSFTFNTLNEMFNKRNLPKNRWGNSFWFIIHHTAIYAPEVLPDNWKLSYKSFISGLQWTIPCGECRAHIKDNLSDLETKNVSIDKYLSTNLKIFEFSVILHNSVNVMLDKPQITLREALNIYRPEYK